MPEHAMLVSMVETSIPTLKELYPTLTDNQLKEAEENLDGYLEIVWRIYQRVSSDPEAYEKFKALTASRKKSYDGARKVDNN
jgi:hypothetical protein